MKWQRFFTFLASQQGKDGMEAVEQRLELTQLQVETLLALLLQSGDLYSPNMRSVLQFRTETPRCERISAYVSTDVLIHRL